MFCCVRILSAAVDKLKLCLIEELFGNTIVSFGLESGKSACLCACCCIQIAKPFGNHYRVSIILFQVPILLTLLKE